MTQEDGPAFSSGFDFEEDDAPVPAVRVRENITSAKSGVGATNGKRAAQSTIDLTLSPSPPTAHQNKRPKPSLLSPSRPTTSTDTPPSQPIPKPSLALPGAGKRSDAPVKSTETTDDVEVEAETALGEAGTSTAAKQSPSVAAAASPKPFATGGPTSAGTSGSRPVSRPSASSFAIPSLSSNTPIVDNKPAAFAAYAQSSTPTTLAQSSGTSTTQSPFATARHLPVFQNQSSSAIHNQQAFQAQRQQQLYRMQSHSHSFQPQQQGHPRLPQASSLGRIPMINTGAAARVPASYAAQSPVSANGKSKDYYRMQSEMVQAGMAGGRIPGQSGFVSHASSSKGKGKEVIDLTNEDDSKSDDEVIVDDTPICIGQLTSLALILYPSLELQAPPLPIQYDAEGRPLPFNPQTTPLPPQPPLPVHVYRAAPQNGHETLRLSTPMKQEVFGVMEHKVADVVAPLFGDGYSGTGVTAGGSGKLWCEASVGRSHERSPIMLPLQLLLFCRPYNIPYVASVLDKSGIWLEHPQTYIPGLHGGYRYSNPHNPVARDAERRRMTYASAMNGNGSWSGAAKQLKTVEVQRQQVEDVFKNLKSGLDLEEQEPPTTLSTRLYPHQKQALSFLLDRERLVDIPERDPPGEETTISLWRRKTDTYGRPVGWANLVTDIQISGSTPPPQARGSILADDMGLGKTIVVISLVATTIDEAKEWAKGPIEKEKFDNRLDTIGEKKVKVADFASQLPGLSAVDIARMSQDKAKMNSKQKAAKIAREKKREDGMNSRFERIVVKSRATLIVCPLSTVQNWESQFEEHVAKPDGEGVSYSINVEAEEVEGLATSGKRGRKGKAKEVDDYVKPKGRISVYVYHGNTRLSDPFKLADHDVVVTTFSTLGTEYSRQVRAEEEREEEAAKEEDSDEPLEVLDADGNVVEKPEPKGKNGKPKRKRKKIEGSGASPLQQVQWFRVVLDEAHIIKEHTTIQARAACDLSASRRTALSGTPLQNSLNDLFSLVRFLRLEPFTDRAVWTQHIGNLAKTGDALGVSRLQLIMRHLALRRTKESVDKDGKPILSLPPNNQTLVHLPFDPAEHAFYSSHHLRYKHDFKKLEESDSVMKNYCSILQELLRLRQICVHMALVRDSEDGAQEGGDLIKMIEQHGISKPRAIQLMGLMRDAGGAVCSECQYDMIPAGAAAAVNDEEEDRKPVKKSRKTTKSATASAACSDEEFAMPEELKSVITKCQHLYCQQCFKKKVYPNWPNDVKADEKATCTVCRLEILPALDCVEVGARELEKALEDAADGDLQVAQGKKAKGTRLFEHSTKTRALIEDVYPFSQANPASANYWGGPTDESDLQMHKPIGFQPVKGEVVKSVVFSQWTKLLDRLGDALDQANIKYGRLDGGMNRDARTRAMDSFKSDPGTEILLVSLRAGGVGLNLTAARRVYLMEPFWNPAVENQAVDRCHRLGQTQSVQTVRFVIEKSIEENMLKIQKRKTDLANMSLSQTLSKAELTKRRMEDLKTLLS